MLPIENQPDLTYGPFTDAYGTVYVKQMTQRTKQAKPYNVATNFTLSCFKRLTGTIDASGIEFGPPVLGYNYPGPLDRATTAASNRAYERLVGKLGESSSFGATLTAELKETWGMMTSTTLRVLRAARAVKALRFAQAADILGVPYREGRRRKVVGYRRKTVTVRGRLRVVKTPIYQTAEYMKFGSYKEIEKSLAGGWLMWSYGVKPLAEDCFNALDHWGRELPNKRFAGGGKETAQWDAGAWSSLNLWKLEVGVVCIAEVSVNNAQLWNANKLGLVNPAQWILEAIPFSFVADWFSNLSQVIMSMSDMLGLKLENPVTCQQHRLVYTSQNRPGFTVRPPSGKEQFFFVRRVGLVLPKLLFKYERFSWQRGLNAISLLVGFKP